MSKIVEYTFSTSILIKMNDDQDEEGTDAVDEAYYQYEQLWDNAEPSIVTMSDNPVGWSVDGDISEEYDEEEVD